LEKIHRKKERKKETPPKTRAPYAIKSQRAHTRKPPPPHFQTYSSESTSDGSRQMKASEVSCEKGENSKYVGRILSFFGWTAEFFLSSVGRFSIASFCLSFLLSFFFFFGVFCLVFEIEFRLQR